MDQAEVEQVDHRVAGGEGFGAGEDEPAAGAAAAVAGFGPVDAVGAAGHDQWGGGLVEAVQAVEQGELGAVVAVDEVRVAEPLRLAGDGW